MDRSTTRYLILHYLLLLLLIFGIVASLDLLVGGVHLLLGVVIAVIIGLAYPRAVATMGVAPTRWER